MMTTNPLSAYECKVLVLAIVHAIESGHQDAAAQMAGLADDPEAFRRILGREVESEAKVKSVGAFDEAKHPRGNEHNAGQFSSGSGGSSGSNSASGAAGQPSQEKPKPVGGASPAKAGTFETPAHSQTVARHLSGETNHEMHAGLPAGSGKQDTFMRDLLAESGRDGRPELTDEAGIEKCRKEGWWICHRGVSKSEHADAFQSGDLYPGVGIFGNGSYFFYAGLRRGSNAAKSKAVGYDGEGGGVITMALPPTARIASHSQLEKERLADLKKLDAARAAGQISPDQHKGMEEIFKDLGRYAALKNYDGIKLKGSGILVVLNRSIAKVQKGPATMTAMGTMDKSFDPNEPRDERGRWASLGNNGANEDGEDEEDEQPTLDELIDGVWNQVSAEDGDGFRSGSDKDRTHQAKQSNEATQEAMRLAEKYISQGDDAASAARRAVANVHHMSLLDKNRAADDESDEAEAERAERVNQLVRRTVSTIENTLGIKFKPAKSGSYYGTFMGLKLRVSDHAQKKGGGYNVATDDRSGEADLQWVLHEHKESTTEAAVISKLANALGLDEEELLAEIQERKQSGIN